MSRRALITKIFEIAGAHYLPNHDGKCRWLHGHNWKIEVELSGPIIDTVPDNPNVKEGMVLDFSDLKSVFNECVFDKLDHKFINDAVPCVTTAENLCWWIFDELVKGIARRRSDVFCCWNTVRMESISVWETPTSKAKVTRQLWETELE